MGDRDSIDARASEGFINKPQRSVDAQRGDRISIDSGGGEIAQRDLDQRRGIFIENLMLGSEASGQVSEPKLADLQATLLAILKFIQNEHIESAFFAA